MIACCDDVHQVDYAVMSKQAEDREYYFGTGELMAQAASPYVEQQQYPHGTHR